MFREPQATAFSISEESLNDYFGFMETLFNVLVYSNPKASDGFETTNMKLAPSSRTLAILFIAILVVSVADTFFIVYNNDTLQKQRNRDIANLNQALNDTATSLNQTDYEMQNLLNGKIDNVNSRLPIGQYDYVIYRDSDGNGVLDYLAKNGRTGTVEFNSTAASEVFNEALANGNSVYVTSDNYTLTSNITLNNKMNSRLDSDGATLTMNGNNIEVNGSDYTKSEFNQVSGFVIIDGTVRIQNSFRTTVTNMIFKNSPVGVELANTNTWSECTKIDTIFFEKCTQSIVFRTNASNIILNQNATGSYANTEVDRCYFKLADNSIAITVETQAEFTDGKMQDIRIWMGEYGKYNETGLYQNGSMYQTQMDGVVFESFAPARTYYDYFYAINIGPSAFQTPVLDSGVNFLGYWSSRIYNPYNKWIFGVGSVFKQTDVAVPVGSSTYGNLQVIQIHPATIASFQAKITVKGTFASNETVTVRFRLEFVDNGVTSDANSVQKSFTSAGSVWLSNDDLMQLYPSLNVIYAILVDAQVSVAYSDASVHVDVYGTAT